MLLGPPKSQKVQRFEDFEQSFEDFAGNAFSSPLACCEGGACAQREGRRPRFLNTSHPLAIVLLYAASAAKTQKR
jgi:hypothetical protein